MKGEMKTSEQTAPKMTILLSLWSDNHGKDAVFGEDSNRPHLILDRNAVEVDVGSNLLSVLLAEIRAVLKIKDDDLIIVVARNAYESWQGIEEVRLRIAENEYVCQAVVGL